MQELVSRCGGRGSTSSSPTKTTTGVSLQLRVNAAEFSVERRHQREVQQRGGGESAERRHGHREFDFVAGFVARQHEDAQDRQAREQQQQLLLRILPGGYSPRNSEW